MAVLKESAGDAWEVSPDPPEVRVEGKEGGRGCVLCRGRRGDQMGTGYTLCSVVQCSVVQYITEAYVLWMVVDRTMPIVAVGDCRVQRLHRFRVKGQQGSCLHPSCRRSVHIRA